MQNVNLNLIPGSVLPVVNVSQYDVGRHFTLTVYEGATAYSLTGKDVQIRGTKPDGNGFAYDSTDGAISVSNNVVTVSTLQQMTACGGQTMCELRITSGSDVLGTINFILDCEPSALSDDTPISDTDIPAIERDFQAALDEAEADALVAEGYAKGTQDGVPAQSGEPYYQDNAKYYKEQAEAAASGGGADALKAEGYAVGTQNGVPVTSGSPYYHNNAKHYEGEAATSASNASTSETNAGLSETAAGNSASAAAADALEAEGFAVGEQNGMPVSSGSPYYHNNAKYYSEQANPTALSNLTDVNITAPSDGQALIYDSNSGEWVNGAGGGGSSTLSGLTDVDITSATGGDDLIYDNVSGKWKNTRDLHSIETYYGAKNLFKTTSATETISDVTITVSGTGQLVLNGTASAAIDYEIGTLTGSMPFAYILNGARSDTAASIQAQVWVGGSYTLYTDTGSGVTIPLTSSVSKIVLILHIPSGTAISSKLFSPMLRDSRILSGAWAEYAKTNRQLTLAEPEAIVTTANTDYCSIVRGYCRRFGRLVVVEYWINLTTVPTSTVAIINGVPARAGNNSLTVAYKTTGGAVPTGVLALCEVNSNADNIQITATEAPAFSTGYWLIKETYYSSKY